MPTLSVAIITLNEEENLARTLASVQFADEVVVVDSGSTDGTLEIARSFGKVLAKFLLLCSSTMLVTESNIFLVSADGSTVVRATNNPGEEDGAPTMSPDGQWIYFESHRAACDDDSPSQIWRIPSSVH